MKTCRSQLTMVSALADRACSVTWSWMTLLGLLLLAGEVAAQASPSGLIATYADGQHKVVTVVPTPDFALRAGESIHPQIAPRFTVSYRGLLKVNRAGRYRVFAEGARVEVKGQVAETFVMLPTGEHPLTIQFERQGDATQLALRWESEFFGEEPVPSSVLGHATTPAEAKTQDRIEHGRYLFAELGCGNCHAANDWNLRSRRGPDLSHVGSRLNAGWMYAWLKNPHEYRKSAVMPVCLETDQDRADVTAYLGTLKSAQPSTRAPATDEKQLDLGRELYEQVGCAKCHDQDHPLTNVGSKYRTSADLTDYIANPHATDPHGRMPQLFLNAGERHLASAVAGHLLAPQRRPQAYPAPPAGDAARGATLFARHGCANCHTVAGAAPKVAETPEAPPFGQAVGLPLRHYWDFGTQANAQVQDQVTGKREQVRGKTAFAAGRGAENAAFDFDGKTWIELSHFHRPDVMTIAVWVKTTRGGSVLTWARPGGGLRGSRELRMNIGQDGKNSLCYGEYNSDGGWRPVIVRPTDVNLVDGQWHHLAVVRQGQSIQHYVDGRPQGSAGVSQPGPGDYTDRLLIGALGLQQNPNNVFQGQMDDLSIWEMALSAEQIASLAQGNSPLAMAQPPQREVKPFDVAAGCLADEVKKTLPNYQLEAADRQALQQFLATVQPEHHYHSAPLTTHDLRIRQFRCTACHQLHDENVQTGVQVDDEGKIIRLERPPQLTGAGDKLTATWLRAVLLEKKRNRPWLNLRMPHFGDSVSDLPELISQSCGIDLQAREAKPDRGLAEAGLAMVGERRGQVACINCHDYRGINRRKDGVVPAPDIAAAARTVRAQWFQRWMHNPSRLQPGTSMPQMFLELPPEERELRIAQLWSALYYQEQLPLPKGVLDKRTDGTRIIVNDQPVIFRMATDTPVGRVDRAINVGIPGGVNFTFDAVSCQLKYVWQGPFLDAGPAWNGRGGNPVRAGNQRLLGIKQGHTLRLGQADAAAKPRFLGYRLEQQLPIFRYALGDAVVELRIDVTESSVIQRFVVSGAPDDVLYVGDGETRFRCETGQRQDETVRFSRAPEIRFHVELLVGESDKN